MAPLAEVQAYSDSTAEDSEKEDNLTIEIFEVKGDDFTMLEDEAFAQTAAGPPGRTVGQAGRGRGQSNSTFQPAPTHAAEPPFRGMFAFRAERGITMIS